MEVSKNLQKGYVGLFQSFVCLLFLKTIFYSQKQREQGKLGEHIWFPMCFCSKKHKENKKHKNQRTRRVFKEHQNDVLFVFKNYSQEQFSKTITKHAHNFCFFVFVFFFFVKIWGSD